jgi:RNA polymerase sigma-70 factor (ECF subfamily)
MVDYIRRSTARPTVEITEGLPDFDPTLETNMEARLDAYQLAQTVQTLTDEQQLVIQLRFVEGLNLEATAQQMRKSVGAIKAMQHRALQQLARKLSK